MFSPFIVPVALFVCVAATVIGLPLARAFAKRMDSGSGPRDERALPDVTARLERMEQAIDSIAVEVERIAEGQRFTTKLLSDRAKAEQPRQSP